MAIDYTKVFGHAVSLTWGGTNMGVKGIVDLLPWYDFEPVQPADYGGQPIAYLLVKKEVIVNVVFHQLDAETLKLMLGPFGDDFDDDFFGGHNVSADANWTKPLIFEAIDGIAGKLKVTCPFATPKVQETLHFSNKHFVTPVQFKCVRGTGDFPLKIEVLT